MRKLTSILLCWMLLVGLALPMTVLARSPEEELWSNEYYRVMDTTGTLTDEEIDLLDEDCIEIMLEYHVDVAFAAIESERVQGFTVEEFAEGLYEDCFFGYGEGKDGFMCIFQVDTAELTVVPMGGAVGLFPRQYLEFMEERPPSLQEKYGLYDVVYGCQELLRSGMETLAEKGQTEPETEPATEPATEPDGPGEKDFGPGGFARCGEGSDKPAWFPADLDQAAPYFDPDAPRVVDYAGIISDKTEAALENRIAELTREIGKDIVIVTDVSNYGMGDDIYAADFYDYNGYGIGPEHEGILLFLDMNPADRGGWTVETGPETRALATRSAVNRLDDFLYDTLATGDYERALTNWVEDVYGFLTTGIARPAFWYQKEVPENFYDPNAPVVVDEWNILSPEQIATLQAQAKAIKETYGVNVYFHTTGDRMGFTEEAYNARYMASMGYEKDAVLLTVENTGGETAQYCHAYFYGTMQTRVPEKFQSRIENNASTASDGYGRLVASQRLLSSYLKNGRVPRNGFYWTGIGIFAGFVGFIVGLMTLRTTESKMKTVRKSTSAYSYLVRSQSSVRLISEILLYITTTRTYIPPRDTSSSSGSSSSGSSYKSSYSGHSGTSHTGHGRKF